MIGTPSTERNIYFDVSAISMVASFERFNGQQWQLIELNLLNACFASYVYSWIRMSKLPSPLRMYLMVLAQEDCLSTLKTAQTITSTTYETADI
jgi:hypothetical protein